MHFLNINDFTKEQIYKFIELISKIKNKDFLNEINLDKEYIANIFLEPSTRTLCSFIKAEYELSMRYINVDGNLSSIKKNETLFDTVITLRQQGFKTFTIRANEDFYLSLLDIPGINIINAGDGINNHPSQSLLDLYTIFEYCKLYNKKFCDLKVLIIGDLKNSRVYKSNKALFEKMGIAVYTFSPSQLSDENYDDKTIKSIEEISNFDIVMLLRIQYERHKENFLISANEYNQKFGLNDNNIKYLKDDAIFMHPGPFNVGIELTREIAYSKKSWILKQVENGVYVRIAIILYALEKVKI